MTDNDFVRIGGRIVVTVPASRRPFVGRLLTEIASVRDGVPAAAGEMGVAPQVIYAIASGDRVSTDDLNAVYRWLSDRVTLEPDEAEDYRRLQAAAREGTRLDSLSPLPPGRTDAQTAPGGSKLTKWTRREVTLATLIVVLVIILTAVITIVIIRPGSSTSTGASGSASPSPSSATPFTGTPSATNSSPVPASSTSSNSPAPTAFPSPSPSLLSGKLIASSNNLKVSVSYGITFASGGGLQPQNSSQDISVDLVYYNSSSAIFSDPNTANGALALLSGAPPSFANCKADTALGSSVSSVSQGDTICFQGHGVVAAAYVVNYGSSGGVDYVTLDVRVWQDPSQSQGSS